MGKAIRATKKTEIKKHIRLAEAKMMQAELSQGPRQELLYAEAKDELIRAEHILPGSGSWKLACICARQGQERLCQKWLERAGKAGALPSRDTLMKSPHLSTVKNKRWFKRLVKNSV